MRLRDRLWLLLSQTVNALVFKGDPDESVSARAWRQRFDGWGEKRHFIDRWLGMNHCRDVFTAQRAREQARTR